MGGRLRPGCRGGTATVGVPRNTVSVDEIPSAYGSCSRCRVRRSVALSPNSASPSTAVTSKPAARICRSSVSARRHFSWKRTRRGNLRALPRLGRQPLLGQIQRRPQHPGAHAGPQRRGDRDLAIGDFAQRAAVLPRDATERRPCLGKLVPSRISTPAALGDHRAQLPPDALGAPRRMRDEMLKGLIGPRIADALEHRAHRLAPTVAQQPEQIPTKRAALRHVREADLERLEPLAQAIEPRRRVARQSRQHRAAAYRSPRKSTSPLISIPSDSGANPWI